MPQPFFEPLNIVARVTYLGIVADRKASLASAPLPRVDVGYDGFPGDCHSGVTRPSCMRLSRVYEPGTLLRNTRQITIVSEEELLLIARDMGIAEIRPQELGANICVSGIPHFSLLPPSSRLVFDNGPSLVIDLENAPCNHPAKLLPAPAENHAAFRAAAQYRRGVCSWVEREGAITVGGTLIVQVPSQPAYPGTTNTQ